MNKPDFTVKFAEQKVHEGCQHKYIVYLEDLDKGNMSLTNGIEDAISETIKMLTARNTVKGFPDVIRVSEVDLCSGKTFWFYKDSMGEYAQVLMVGTRPQFIYLAPERAEKILALMCI